MKKGKKVEGVIDFKSNGNAYLILEGDDLFIHKSKCGQALNGDVVAVDIISDKRGDGIQGVVSGIIFCCPVTNNVSPFFLIINL